ncbi:uncharacterized protein [Rutidosis leptorrhynchoides]|uniref:uncharacterized protein n=1 Tax=Rutidosis leptorrhynchoides TaxID=125765 RepID=UPI003A9A65E0
MALDRLPTRVNLSNHGVDVPNIHSSVCSLYLEDVQHTFFGREVAASLWRMCRICLDIALPVFSSLFEFLSWFDDWRESEETNMKVYSIVAALLWIIWRFRNSLAFPGDGMKKPLLFDSIRNISFNWCISRGKCMISWNDWLVKPL